MDRETIRVARHNTILVVVIIGILSGVWLFVKFCDDAREASLRRQYPATSTVTDVIWVPEHMESLYKHAEFTGDATIKGTCVIERVQ